MPSFELSEAHFLFGIELPTAVAFTVFENFIKTSHHLNKNDNETFLVIFKHCARARYSNSSRPK